MFFPAVLQAAPLELCLPARWSLVAPAGRLGRLRGGDAGDEWTAWVDGQNKAKHSVPNVGDEVRRSVRLCGGRVIKSVWHCPCF